MDRSSRYITITEEDLKGLLNESSYKWYHVNDVTKITRFAADVKSHPISDDMDLNQYNNIHKIIKFHDYEEFREHLKETNKSRIHYANYKEIDNYWDFVGFKHKLIDKYNAIRVEEEDKQEVFIRGQKAYKKNYGDEKIPKLRIIDYYVSCTYEDKEGVKFHDTLHIKIINVSHYGIGKRDDY